MLDLKVPLRGWVSIAVLLGGLAAPPAAAQGSVQTLTADAQRWVAQAAVLVDDQMRYPFAALRLQRQGTSELTVHIDRSGRVVSYDVVASSGHRMLDLESQRLVDRIGAFPAVPASLDGGQISFRLRLHYYIAGTASQQRRLLRRLGLEGAAVGDGLIASIELLPGKG